MADFVRTTTTTRSAVRNRLIHAYFSVDWINVWDVLTHEIPDQKHLIQVLMEECDESLWGK